MQIENIINEKLAEYERTIEILRNEGVRCASKTNRLELLLKAVKEKWLDRGSTPPKEFDKAIAILKKYGDL